MATTTSRLALRKPELTDQVNVDTDLSANFDKVDAAVGATICTSTTRPASPYQGQFIFETDTSKTYVRSSAAWILATPAYTPPTVPGPQTLTDGATVATNVSTGSYFRLTAAGDRTLSAPTGSPADGQTVTWEILASGANRTITLATGAAGAFLFGTTITALTATVSGKRDLIRAIYNTAAARWLVVAYTKGF